MDLSFIPWAVHDQQFAITPPSLVRICATIGVPALFIEGLFALDYATRPGDGLFFYQAENGAYLKIGLSFPNFSLSTGVNTMHVNRYLLPVPFPLWWSSVHFYGV